VTDDCCDQASELAANAAMSNPPTRKAERLRLMFSGISVLETTMFSLRKFMRNANLPL